MKPTDLLQHINRLHNTTFKLLERYPDGEQGAFAIIDLQGQRYVLKWSAGVHNLDRIQEARIVTNLLRDLNYPAPHYLFIGSALEGIYSVQRALPGSPMHNLTITLVPRLLELNGLQDNQALPDLPSWHQEVVNTVLFGGNGYCLHSSLQQHSRETRNLLKNLQALTSTHQYEPHRTMDIVHNDFQPANILVHADQISGIIDWDAPYAGDRIFDIATLLFYTYDDAETRVLLWQYVLERVSLNLLCLYFAHLILRQVDWSLRYHDQALSDLYIVRGQAVLQKIT